MPNEPDHILLRRHAAARRSGDDVAAVRIWKQLALNNWDRIQENVGLFRFPGQSHGLPRPDQGSAASDAFIRVADMGPNFEALEAGAYYAAVYRTVWNTCMDAGRKELRHQKRSAGSLDALPDDADAPRLDGFVADYERHLEEADEAEQSRTAAAGAIAWAIDQMTNDNHREVIVMTQIEQLSAAEVADRLGISVENVYQRRSRGMAELKRILHGHGS